jgi:hypothetical protein
MHGIAANPGNREWEPFPLSFFVFCRNPVHRVMVNWDPPISQYLGQPGGNQKGNHSITASKKQDKNKSGISKQRVCGGGSTHRVFLPHFQHVSSVMYGGL